MTAKALFIAVLAFFLLNATFFPGKAVSPAGSRIDSIYMVLESTNSSLPSRPAFDKAMEGLFSIQGKGSISPEIVSIIDFTKPSSEKRLWVLNVKQGKVLHHTLVAHGKNSGDLFAKKFSNVPESLQSSLGLFVTGKTYIGKHGLSLKLYGLEPGVNDLAESRAIVIHSADYVSESFIKRNGRLGRSFGCPAIPLENHKEIINTLANGSYLYVHYTSM